MPAFKEKQTRGKRGDEKKINAFDLLPTSKTGARDAEAEIYRLKMICYIASEGNAQTQEWLYSQNSLLHVYEMIMFKRANEYNLHD